MARNTASNSVTDGGRDWPLGVVNLVEKYGHVPRADAVDSTDVDEDVLDAIHQLHDQADEEDILVDELVLELKRINSVIDGIPNEQDVQEWDGISVQTYESVFGSVENAIEFAFASKSGELMLSIDEYTQSDIEE